MRGMESGFATPLLEFFKHGEVAADVKLLAAQGAIAPARTSSWRSSFCS